jgi:hypothetical protein
MFNKNLLLLAIIICIIHNMNSNTVSVLFNAESMNNSKLHLSYTTLKEEIIYN